jgi:hypothetical protein
VSPTLPQADDGLGLNRRTKNSYGRRFLDPIGSPGLRVEQSLRRDIKVSSKEESPDIAIIGTVEMNEIMRIARGTK